MKILRILSIVIAAIAMVGFGLCGLLGIAAGVEPARTGDWLNIFFFLGFCCLAACGALAWFLVKKFRNAPPPGQ
jgi:hypothetical protein